MYLPNHDRRIFFQIKKKKHINRFNKHTEHQVARGRKNLPILYLKPEIYTQRVLKIANEKPEDT